MGTSVATLQGDDADEIVGGQVNVPAGQTIDCSDMAGRVLGIFWNAVRIRDGGDRVERGWERFRLPAAISRRRVWGVCDLR